MIVDELRAEISNKFKNVALKKNIESQDKASEIKKNQIVYLLTSELFEHPRQNEIYGVTTVEDDFVETIEERGILQPLLVTPCLGDMSEPAGYYIVSGHRRCLGAELAGLQTVPCEIKPYDNFEDSFVDLVFSNRQREKTKQQKANEINELKQILCQIAKRRQASGIAEVDSDGSDEVFPNGKTLENVSDILREIESSPLDSCGLIAEKLGVSKKEVSQIIAISNDEHQQQWINKAYDLGAKDSEIKEAVEEWGRVRGEYFSEEISLSAAYNEITALKKDLEHKYKPKEKASSKPKKEKAQKVVEPFVCPHCGALVEFSEIQKYIKALK